MTTENAIMTAEGWSDFNPASISAEHEGSKIRIGLSEYMMSGISANRNTGDPVVTLSPIGKRGYPLKRTYAAIYQTSNRAWRLLRML